MGRGDEWDGVPPDVDDLEVAAQFGVDAAQSGDVLVHCGPGAAAGIPFRGNRGVGEVCSPK